MNCELPSPRLPAVKTTYRSRPKKSSRETAMQQQPVKLEPYQIKKMPIAAPLPTTPPKQITPARPQKLSSPHRPNILRKSSPAKPAVVKSRSVNLSPMMYSPTLKRKNPLAEAVPESRARIITSYVKEPAAPAPRKAPPAPSAVSSIPRKTFTPSLRPSNDKITCDVEHRTADTIFLSCKVGGNLFSGVLVSHSLRHSLATDSATGRYVAEQLPSQYLKKLKTKLGLSLENGGTESMESTEGESSAPAPAAAAPAKSSKLVKLSNNDLKALQQQQLSSGSSVEEQPIKKPEPIKKSEPKLKISGSLPKPNTNGPSPKSNLPCAKKQKTDGPSGQKAKFGAKFIKPAPATATGTATSAIPPRPAALSSAPVSHHSPARPGPASLKPASMTPAEIKAADQFRQKFARSLSCSEDLDLLYGRLMRNSGKLHYMDLEWPRWCPRQLQLRLQRRVARPASLKRREAKEWGSEESEQKRSDIYTEKNNPFGIGDVIIAKRTLGPGRPYWPGRVLSVTGLTICVQFYGTDEVMQIAKSNVSWFYDGCYEHRLSFDPFKDSTEWKDALDAAGKDVRQCIGVGSVVWGIFEEEWWPATVTALPSPEKYKVRWLDDRSQQILEAENISPFLLSFGVRYDEEMADTYVSYQTAVDSAEREALHQLLP